MLYWSYHTQCDRKPPWNSILYQLVKAYTKLPFEDVLEQ